MKVGKRIFILLSLILCLIPLMSGCENLDKSCSNWVEYRIIVVFSSTIESQFYYTYREYSEDEFVGSTWKENMKQQKCEKLYLKEENGYSIIKRVLYNGEEIIVDYKTSECLILKEKVKNEREKLEDWL